MKDTHRLLTVRLVGLISAGMILDITYSNSELTDSLSLQNLQTHSLFALFSHDWLNFRSYGTSRFAHHLRASNQRPIRCQRT